MAISCKWSVHRNTISAFIIDKLIQIHLAFRFVLAFPPFTHTSHTSTRLSIMQLSSDEIFNRFDGAKRKLNAIVIKVKWTVKSFAIVQSHYNHRVAGGSRREGERDRDRDREGEREEEIQPQYRLTEARHEPNSITVLRLKTFDILTRLVFSASQIILSFVCWVICLHYYHTCWFIMFRLWIVAFVPIRSVHFRFMFAVVDVVVAVLP